MPALVDELAALQAERHLARRRDRRASAPTGMPDFNALQNAFDGTRTREIVYFVFDVPYFEGHDLRAAPLVERRAAAGGFVEQHGSETRALQRGLRRRPGEPDALGRTAEARRRDRQARRRALRVAPHRRPGSSSSASSARSSSSAATPIAAATPMRGEIGSLLLGVLRRATASCARSAASAPAGSAGTARAAEGPAGQAGDRRHRRSSRSMPKPSGRWSKRARAAERWVKPQLVAEVSFGDWTPDGQIRHAIFIGLRDDKPAKRGEARGRPRRRPARCRSSVRANGASRSRTPSA